MCLAIAEEVAARRRAEQLAAVAMADARRSCAEALLLSVDAHAQHDERAQEARAGMRSLSERVEAVWYVLDEAERSLHDACAKERIAGIDADALMRSMLPSRILPRLRSMPRAVAVTDAAFFLTAQDTDASAGGSN